MNLNDKQKSKTAQSAAVETQEEESAETVDDIYSEDFISDIEAEDCVDIYCSSTGIWLGGYDIMNARTAFISKFQRNLRYAQRTAQQL